jgi:hypothetical protein
MGISAALGPSAFFPAGLGFRNLIINGNMRINQRGTTTSIAAGQAGALVYTADRWAISSSDSGLPLTLSMVDIVSTSPGVDYAGITPIERYIRWYGGTGASRRLIQRIENVNSLPPFPVTVSFWAKSPSNNAIQTLRIVQNFGTGGSPSSQVSTTVATSISLSSSWKEYSYTFVPPSISGKTLGTTANTSYVALEFENSSFSSFEYHITNVQVEVNLKATPFEQRPIGAELALCQRYFWAKPLSVTGLPSFQISGFGTYAVVPINVLNPVPMRAVPSASTDPTYPIGSYPPYIADNNSNLRTITSYGIYGGGLGIQFNYSGAALGNGTIYFGNWGDPNRTLWLSSEL